MYPLLTLILPTSQLYDHFWVPTPASSKFYRQGSVLSAVGSPPARTRANMNTIFPKELLMSFKIVDVDKFFSFLTYPTFSVAHLCDYPSNPLQIHLTSLELWNQYTHLGLISSEHNSRITFTLFENSWQNFKTERHNTLTSSQLLLLFLIPGEPVLKTATTSLQLFLTYKSS